MGKNSDREAFQNIVNKLLDVRNLKDLRLKHYHMSSAQFKKRTTHSDIPGKVDDHRCDEFHRSVPVQLAERESVRRCVARVGQEGLKASTRVAELISD